MSKPDGSLAGLAHQPRFAVDEVPGTGPGTLLATVAGPAEVTAGALARLPAGVTGLEIRADLAGDLDPRPLRRHVTGPLIYTLRSQWYGGGSPDRDAARWARLIAAAARGYDLVDLEADRDLVPAILTRIPARQRRVWWQGSQTDLAGLRKRFEWLAGFPARWYVLAPGADSLAAALVPARLLASLRRADVTAFATGTAGLATRVLAPWLGAPVLAGAAAPTADAPSADAPTADAPSGDGPTVYELASDYPVVALPPVRDLAGIVGRSLHTSVFLSRFNAAYRTLGIPALFLPFPVGDLAAFRDEFWPVLAAGGFDELGLPLRCLTVAAPYKDAAFRAASRAGRDARRARAANLLLRRGDEWYAATTDGTAAVAALRAVGPLRGRPVAVVGCGAAGRAAAVALVAAGARVTLVNRGQARGRFAAELLGLDHIPLHRFAPRRYSIVVHATPVTDHPPFDVDSLPAHATVVDFVCPAQPTALVTAARQRGLTVVDGQQIVAREMVHQFPLMTGRPLPAVDPVRGPAATR